MRSDSVGRWFGGPRKTKFTAGLFDQRGAMFVKMNRTNVGTQRLNRSDASRFCHRYFFCAKISGGAYFTLDAGKDRRFPADEAVGVLAMHCMVRGLSPRDYAVFVPLEELSSCMCLRCSRNLVFAIASILRLRPGATCPQILSHPLRVPHKWPHHVRKPVLGRAKGRTLAVRYQRQTARF